VLLRRESSNANDLASAPITQLIGVDAKNVVTCDRCKSVREKENMTHILELTYTRKVPNALLHSAPATEKHLQEGANDFASILRSSLLRTMAHKATCPTCRHFSSFTSHRSIPSSELPPLLAVNAAVYNDDSMDTWLDSRGSSLLKPYVEICGQVGDSEDPVGVRYEVRVSGDPCFAR
jgi:Ubiquitin carboxyl-terminal hydrolase